MEAATADALYGCVAGFGLTVVSGFLVGQRFWIQLIGGMFLLALGIRTLRSVPVEREAAVSGTGLAASYASTFLLTLTNPMTIISFAGIFAALGVADTGGDLSAAALLVAGVFAGFAAVPSTGSNPLFSTFDKRGELGELPVDSLGLFFSPGIQYPASSIHVQQTPSPSGAHHAPSDR